MSFKDISYLELWQLLCSVEQINCVILVEGIMRKILLHNFEFGPVVQDEMSFKDISYLEPWQPFTSAEQNHLCNFVKRHYEEQFCELIMNFDQWFRRKCH